MPPTLTLTPLRHQFWTSFWYLVAWPIIVVGLALATCTYYRLLDKQRRTDFAGDAVSVILTSDYKPGFEAGRRDAAHPGNKVDDPAAASMRAIRDHQRECAVDEILSVVVDSMATLRISSADLFAGASRRGYEADAPSTQTGARGAVFTRPEGLAPWEFIKALKSLGVSLTPATAELLITEVQLTAYFDENVTSVSYCGARVTLDHFDFLLRRAALQHQRPFAMAGLDQCTFTLDVLDDRLSASLGSNESLISSLSTPFSSAPLRLAQQLESVLLRVFHGLGSARDPQTAGRVLDAENKGYFTQAAIQKALRVGSKRLFSLFVQDSC
jgi:hypothetical protein